MGWRFSLLHDMVEGFLCREHRSYSDEVADRDKHYADWEHYLVEHIWFTLVLKVEFYP